MRASTSRVLLTPVLVASVGLISLTSSCRRPVTGAERVELARSTLTRLHELVARRVSGGSLVRADGFIYTVDVAQLMLFAARAGDEDLYLGLRSHAVGFVRDDESDPYTKGFVYWRFRDDEPPDASGTTEALRLAEAFWEGGKRFGREDDRAIAVQILDGYRRHQSEEQGVWMIRNYFNLGTRAFATNSFLVDYAPDFIAHVAQRTNNDDLRLVARRSYQLVRAARTPSGLLYDVVQPELATLWDDKSMVYFSPNDVVQISNAAIVASYVVEGDPETARSILNFCKDRMPSLGHSYRGQDGRVVWSKRPGIETWASLTKVAMAVGDAEAVDTFFVFLESNAARIHRLPDDAWLFVASELLLGLQAIAGDASAPPSKASGL